MSLFRRQRREVPMLNTAALPDLIFTVLFFFITVTHMREVTLKVKYRVPEGTELTSLVKKSAVTYIYIGRLYRPPCRRHAPLRGRRHTHTAERQVCRR